MALKQYRSTMFLAYLVLPGLLASCTIADGTDGDDSAELADHVRVHPDSVVWANQCGVRYSLSQSTSILFVSQSGLRADISVTAVSDGSMPGITSINFAVFAEVDPTPLADNQNAAGQLTQQTQSGLSTDPPVSASATWANPTQFQNGNLCTAAVTSNMFVNYTNAPTCRIRASTTYPTCVTNH